MEGGQQEEGSRLIYSDWDIWVRELGAGTWFWISLFLTIAFVGYLIRRSAKGQLDFAPVTYAVASLAVFTSGSALRAFLQWMQFLYIRNDWDYQQWLQTWPWFGLSVTMNIVGAAGAIWFLSHYSHRTIYTAIAVGVALGVPIAVFTLVD